MENVFWKTVLFVGYFAGFLLKNIFNHTLKKSYSKKQYPHCIQNKVKKSRINFSAFLVAMTGFNASEPGKLVAVIKVVFFWQL